VNQRQQQRATIFRGLHHQDQPLIVPNAWDAGSAVLIVRAGASAIATTSAGISWSLGRRDDQALTREEMADAVRRITDYVDVPVSADVESGYGPEPDAVAETVRAVIAAGAVGINLEDHLADGSLFEPKAQMARIQAARAAAQEEGLADFVINLRTDVYLFGIGEPADRKGMTLSRGLDYAEAGADCLFVPGVSDTALIAELVREMPIPINVLVGPGSPPISELAAAGVKRISLGSSISVAAYSLAERAAVEALTTGTYGALEGAADYGAINQAFAPRS
jgi:2-methylisocitrate lyase-like PEP mutase family enzyme